MKARAALSLVEVLVALALLAGTVLFLLQAQQSALASLECVNEQSLVDRQVQELITQWKLAPKTAPRDQEGTFGGASKLHWRRSEQLFDARHAKLWSITLTVTRRTEDGVDKLIQTYSWLESRDAQVP